MNPVLRACRRRLGDDEAGFTLIEAIVSFVIFLIVLTSATWAIVNAIRTSHTTQQRVQAADLAQYVVDAAVRQADDTKEIPAPGTTIDSHVGKADLSGNGFYAEYDQFKIVQTVIYDTAGSCNTGTMFTINVEVYEKNTSKFLARSDARVACPHI